MTESAAAAPGRLARLAEFVQRHRRWVVVTWLVLLIAGAAGAGQVSKRLSFDFSMPGQPGWETAQKIERLYGNGLADPSILVVTVPAGQTVARQEDRIAAAFDQLRHSDPRLRVVDYASTHDATFVTRDGRTTYAFVFAPQPRGFGSALASRAAVTTVGSALPHGTEVTATGLQELATGGTTKGPGVLVETLLGGLGALAVLAFVFASLLAFVPLLVAAVSITSTLLVILGLSYVADVSAIVQFLVSLVGLGVAIDYSLLIVTRWREERDLGHDNTTAVTNAMTTAGHAVLLSGLTVAIGLIALVVLPVPGLRSVGYGGMLIPLVSTAVSLTLLPAMLAGIGQRLDWPHVRHETRASRAWTAWGRGVVRRRWLAAGVATAVLGLLMVPFFSLTVGQTSADALAKTGSARSAYDTLLAGGVPSGVLTPMEVLTRSDATQSTATAVERLPGIQTAAVSTSGDSNRGGTSVVLAIPHTETVNSETLAPVKTARSALAHRPGVVGIAGDGAIQLDYEHAVFGHFPLMLGVIALLTFILLARAFRSLVLPLKAILLNLVSMSATFGLMTWFWQEGHGSQTLFSIPATGAITFWLPLMVFAFLYGLSMDYEVFILSRVREEYERTGSTDVAVVNGLGRTGRLVTSAALILFLAFASLASAPMTDLKVLATGLGAGILLDATVVRALLLPALVSLFGKWNWWMPAPVARLLRLPAAGPARQPAQELEPLTR